MSQSRASRRRLTCALSNGAVTLIELCDGGVNGAGVVGSAAATGADDIRAGGEDFGNGTGGFLGRLFVYGFAFFENG